MSSASGYPYYYQSSKMDIPHWIEAMTGRSIGYGNAQVPDSLYETIQRPDISGLQQQVSANVASSAKAQAPALTSAVPISIPTNLTETTTDKGTKPVPIRYPDQTGRSVSGAVAQVPYPTQQVQPNAINPYMGVSTFALQHSYDTSNPLVQAALLASQGTSGQAMTAEERANERALHPVAPPYPGVERAPYTTPGGAEYPDNPFSPFTPGGMPRSGYWDPGLLPGGSYYH